MRSKLMLPMVLVVVLAGCQQGAGMADGSDQAAQLTRSGGWTVSAVKDMPVLPEDAESWFEFDAEQQRLVGDTACNRMSAGYQMGDGDALTLSSIVATKRACEPPRMAMERALVENLQAVTSWRISDGHLMLRDADGVVRVVAYQR